MTMTYMVSCIMYFVNTVTFCSDHFALIHIWFEWCKVTKKT